MWGYVTVLLECGCEGHGQWDVDWPGDEQACSTHGPTTIQRISRVSTPSTRSNYQLGVIPGEVSDEQQAGAA